MPEETVSQLAQEVRRLLHDMSNALTVTVGTAELLSRNGHLSDADKEEMQKIVTFGYECCSLLEKARILLARMS